MTGNIYCVRSAAKQMKFKELEDILYKGVNHCSLHRPFLVEFCDFQKNLRQYPLNHENEIV